VIATLAAFFIAVAGVQAASLNLLRAALDPNPTLQSYIARATLVARVHPLPIAKKFTGTAYYVKPKAKIVFDHVPPVLNSLRALDMTTPTFADATANYAITPLTNDGRSSTFGLDPKHAGSRVKSLVLTLDDDAAVITNAVWSYTNGGSLRFKWQRTTIGIYRVPSTIQIAASFPGYAIDGVIQLSNYRMNVGVPPDVFEAAQ
jgi:hypothetical protein